MERELAASGPLASAKKLAYSGNVQQETSVFPGVNEHELRSATAATHQTHGAQSAGDKLAVRTEWVYFGETTNWRPLGHSRRLQR